MVLTFVHLLQTVFWHITIVVSQLETAVEAGVLLFVAVARS